MNAIIKIIRFLAKDIEYPRKAWLESILTAWSMALSIMIGIAVIIERAYYGYGIILALIMGGVVGCIVSMSVADRIKNKYKSIAQFTLVNCICFTFLLFKFWDYSEVELFFFFFVLVTDTTIVLLHFCVIVFQTTTILERGRVAAGILGSIALAAPVVYLVLNVNASEYVLYFVLYFYIAFLLKMNKHNEVFLSPRISIKEMFNETVIKYLIILCGFGFVEGLFLSYDALDPTRFGFLFSAFVLPAILFASFILAGMTFDLYGRRRSLSLIVLLLGIYAFLASLESYVNNINASTAAYIASIILNVIALLTIIGDISVAPAKILPMLMIFDVGSIIGGYFVRNLLLSTGITELPFISGSFGLLVISIVLINTHDLLPEQEQNWDKALIAMYVIYNSGVLLYHQVFNAEGKREQEHGEYPHQSEVVPDLISSGLVGITQLMQEIVQGKQILRYIDNYSKKILLESGKYIIVALIVLNDSRILRDKLRKFIEEFEIEFHDELESTAGHDMNKFESTKDLVRKYFDVKYFMDFGARTNEGHHP